MTAATVLGLLVAAGASGLALVALFHFRRYLPLSHVNERTLHQGAVPRVAGLALWLGFVPVALVLAGPPWLAPSLWGGPWLLLFAVSLKDDVRSVGVAVRLVVHLAASAWFAWSLSILLALPWWGGALAFLAAAWSLNLYNFMDGSDGLAITMTIVGFASMGCVLAARGESGAIPLAVAAAGAPLLLVNMPPARMFMGDVGAVPLGFLAAAMGAAGVAAGAWQAWFPLLAFLPFVADATATLARRMLRGERFWESHRSHYYQRLLRLGAGHAGTLAAYGALMLGCAGTAIACALLAPHVGPWALASWCAAHAAIFVAIDYHWRRSPPPT